MTDIQTIFDHPGNVEHRYCIVDGYRTHYIEAGKPESEPVVLVHGGSAQIGMGVDRWYPTIIPLAHDFRVVAVDELGHGDTDAPRRPEDLSLIRARADHVLQFVESLGLGPVNLLGQSQGGWIAAYIAIVRPDLVKRLVLIDSGSLSGSTLGGKLPYFERLFEAGTMVPKDDLTTREGIRKHVSEFCYGDQELPEQFIDRLFALSRKWNSVHMDSVRQFWQERGHEKRRDMYSIDGRHINELVHTISAPTLLIWGKQSNKGLDPGVELYKRLNRCQMHIFDRANHFVWIDQPTRFNTLLGWYLHTS